MTTTFETIINQRNPHQLLLNLTQISLNDIELKENYNWWLGVAEHATNQFDFRSSSAEEAMAWAKVAIFAYNHPINNSESSVEQSIELSEMLFRLRLLERFGVNYNSDLLNPKIIEDWFWARLEFSFEEAKELSKNWISLPIEKIRDLRRIKSRLSILVLLKERNQLSDNPAFKDWLNLKNKLP
jgi:hypothetical protein